MEPKVFKKLYYRVGKKEDRRQSSNLSLWAVVLERFYEVREEGWYVKVLKGMFPKKGFGTWSFMVRYSDGFQYWSSLDNGLLSSERVPVLRFWSNQSFACLAGRNFDYLREQFFSSEQVSAAWLMVLFCCPWRGIQYIVSNRIGPVLAGYVSTVLSTISMSKIDRTRSDPLIFISSCKCFGLSSSFPRQILGVQYLLHFPFLSYLPTTHAYNYTHTQRYISSVQSLSRVRLFTTPWTTARQASLSITNSQSPPKLMSIKSVMPSNHLILYSSLLLLPSIFPSIRYFSN